MVLIFAAANLSMKFYTMRKSSAIRYTQTKMLCHHFYPYNNYTPCCTQFGYLPSQCHVHICIHCYNVLLANQAVKGQTLQTQHGELSVSV